MNEKGVVAKRQPLLWAEHNLLGLLCSRYSHAEIIMFPVYLFPVPGSANESTFLKKEFRLTETLSPSA